MSVVARSSTSAAVAITASATAAPSAAPLFDDNNGGEPTAVISKAAQGAGRTPTGSAAIALAAEKK